MEYVFAVTMSCELDHKAAGIALGSIIRAAGKQVGACHSRFARSTRRYMLPFAGIVIGEGEDSIARPNASLLRMATRM